MTLDESERDYKFKGELGCELQLGDIQLASHLRLNIINPPKIN